jgi:hypothetical protein
MDVLSYKNHIARKSHKCNFCSGEIKIGETYQCQAIKGDGFYIWKSHLRCIEICNKLDMFSNSDEGVTNEDFYEIITEEFRNLQTKEDYDIPDFYGQLNYVCEKHAVKFNN